MREAIEHKLDQQQKRDSMNKNALNSFTGASDLRWQCPGCKSYRVGSMYDLNNSPCICGWTNAKST